ncbi:glutathione S-transferase family protein [Sphingomonas ginkgonis]|uniref:Glutathione S-transferase family protein n=1 Tax=Sphingomonas ginkgonis TaxID=2315330 RepID=A0A3S0ENX3_9SPHN|nr:glutathione S-transferase family protein [Sphingomonas ginkgonis]RST31840.1 glutathione S-transferase family protein [Sphingomonas ginkgonis]
MAELIFYTNPQSRGQTVRWMLEEVGAPYDVQYLDYATSLKAEPYLSVNPMGKIPAIRHGDKVVTEVAAICCYLADAFPAANLAPAPENRAAYYRYIFFASGPIEAAFSNKAAGWAPSEQLQRMFGYGNFDLATGVLEKLLTGRDYISENRFTAADLFVGAMVNFMLRFKLLEPTPVFTDYIARVTDREAYRRAVALDEQAGHELAPTG